MVIVHLMAAMGFPLSSPGETRSTVHPSNASKDSPAISDIANLISEF